MSSDLRIEKDPFRYGYRWVEGPEGYEMAPLAYADLLDPQEGDFMRFGESGKGPGPDICVVRGVRDPARRRGSFWFGHEPGHLVLVLEIVMLRFHAIVDRNVWQPSRHEEVKPLPRHRA